MERRWGNRLVLNEWVGVSRDETRLGTACLHEVSLSGGFLKASWPMSALTRICLHFPEPNRRRTRSVEAYVVRPAAEGVGIEWSDFAPPVIASLIEFNTRALQIHSAQDATSIEKHFRHRR